MYVQASYVRVVPSRWDIDNNAFKTFQRKAWNCVADQLPSLSSTTMFTVTAAAVESLLDAVHAGPDTHLLDVACGPGQWLEHALARGAKVTAIDLAEHMIEEARRRHQDADFHVGDAEHLDFADQTFDAVTCNFGVQMFAQPEQAMEEALRVLRPGGWYAFTSWCPSGRNDFFSLLRSAIETHEDTDADLPEGPPHLHYGTIADCEDRLRQIGFVEVMAQEIMVHAELSRPELILDLMSTTDRTRMTVSAQSPDARSRIENAMIEGVRAYEVDGIFRLPMPMIQTRGRRPSPR